jgi:ligand-binding sensor domain-containing protein
VGHRCIAKSRAGLAQWGLLSALWLPFVCAHALELGLELHQFHHTAWTLKDGGPGQVQAIAQTRDGYLWLGTPYGLFRFDGVRFESLNSISHEPLASNDIFSVAAEASGGLWVGFTSGGAALVKDGHVRNYGESDGLATRDTAYRFTMDAEGITWVLTGTGPFKFNGKRWDAIEKKTGYPEGGLALDMVFDADGTMWVSTRDRGIFYRARSTLSLKPVPLPNLNWAQLALAPDGRVWVSDPIKERGTRPLPRPGISSTWQDKWWKADAHSEHPAEARRARPHTRPHDRR